jgi:hypothetical protein
MAVEQDGFLPVQLEGSASRFWAGNASVRQRR